MFGNYLKIALRNLTKQKSFTFINIIGLAVGMACFILILLFVQFELGYDRFHENADRIYRIAIERKYPDKSRFWGRTAFPVGRTFPVEYPEIVQGTRIVTNFNASAIVYEDKTLYNDRVCFADPNFFDVFTVTLLRGDPTTALSQPNSAVITRKTADALFGDGEAVNRTLNINGADYTITAVSKEMPAQSHFHFDFLLSLNSLPIYEGRQWINAWGAFTYFLLREDADARALEAKFPEMVKKYMAPEVVDEVKSSFEDFVAAGNGYRFFLQALGDIHLRSSLDQELEPNGSITTIYLFALISVFILLIACINFMNLTTSRSAGRAREVGVRKTVGSTRPQLIVQFLLESTLLSFLALLIAVSLVQMLLPAFNRIAGIPLTLTDFSPTLVLPALIGYVLVVGFLAGSYPAFFLSSFQPVTVLKGRLRKGTVNSRLRNVLVIFQFTISIMLIISTLIVHRQIQYMLNKDLGFDKEHVVVIKNTRMLGQRYQAFKQSLRARSDVVSLSGSAGFPAGAFDGNVHRPEGMSDDQAVSLSVIVADYDYLETMGMELTAGRSFSREFSTDPNAYVLNDTAVRMLGLRDPVGSRITDHFRHYTVIGVVKDFHFKSLHSPISPLAYIGIPDNVMNFLSVRIRPGDISRSLSSLAKTWGEFSGGRPFEYSFLDDDLTIQYEAERKTRQLAGIFSLIAIFIGCLGLFGLAAFTAEQRTKEIGVRKVMGATIPGIVLLLVRDFAKLVILAFVIATPAAYFALQNWLGNFAYSITMRAAPFLTAGILAMGIALLTVSSQAVRAARSHPVESLRYE